MPQIRPENNSTFGMVMSDRAWTSAGGGYRFGFNGQEKDDEVKGEGNSLDFGARVYDSRLGRWLSVDPKKNLFPGFGPYNAMNDNPVNIIDPNGESGEAVVKGNKVVVKSTLIFYGDASTRKERRRATREIRRMWNKANGKVTIDGKDYKVKFKIKRKSVSVERATRMAQSNTSAINNFIRVEETNNKMGGRSFMDVGGNSGHWVTSDNLGKSTTAAHEFGHGYGLLHSRPNLIGTGVPDIMAARGTLVDPQYQYDPSAAPGKPGGTVDPSKREVLQSNISNMFAGITFTKDTTGIFKGFFRRKKANIGSARNTIYDKNGNKI